jgi:phage terminase large subunit GpA-like protein
MRILMAAVDSGYLQDEVIRFTRPRANRGWCAVKGASTYGRPIISRPSKLDISARGKELSYSAQQWLVGVDTAKEAIFRRLSSDRARPIVADRLTHFPSEIDESFYSQLTAEVWDPNRRRWIKVRQRNEALDAWCYAIAAANHPRVGIHKWREPQWAQLQAAIEPDGDLFSVQQQPQKPQPKEDLEIEKRRVWSNKRKEPWIKGRR